MTTASGPLGVLVGFDGSDHAVRALHWGAAEALQRNLGLTVMTAFTIPRMGVGFGHDSSELTPDTLARRGAEQTLDEARDYLLEYPGQAQFHVEYGDAAGVLVAHSSQADVAVVGARGRGGFIGRVLGSVSSALPAHAACPAVIVDRSYELPQPEDSDKFERLDQRPITVGMDTSAGARVAVEQAAQIAANKAVPLRVVMAVPPLDGTLLWYPEVGPREEELARRRRELEDRVQSHVRQLSVHYDQLAVSADVIDGLPVEVLREETRHAQLTVVGTRGRGKLATAMLGSTSSGVIMHASGPVMVVPSPGD